MSATVKYRVTNYHGEIVATLEELFEIARLWIDGWNENEQDEDQHWGYPNSEDDVKEILVEYMECWIEECEEKEETVEDKYRKLTLA